MNKIREVLGFWVQALGFVILCYTFGYVVARIMIWLVTYG